MVIIPNVNIVAQKELLKCKLYFISDKIYKSYIIYTSIKYIYMI